MPAPAPRREAVVKLCERCGGPLGSLLVPVEFPCRPEHEEAARVWNEENQRICEGIMDAAAKVKALPRMQPLPRSRPLH